MSRESAFFVSSQKRTTSAPSAYATHLLLFISLIDSLRLGFCTAYVVPATLNDELRFSALTHPSLLFGANDSVSAPSSSDVKQSNVVSFSEAVWQMEG